MPEGIVVWQNTIPRISTVHNNIIIIITIMEPTIY